MAAPNWFERNWKWLIPLVVVIFFLGLALAVWGFLGLFKRSDAYQGALRRVQASPAVVEALGSPIKDGFMFTGQINIMNDTGTAHLSFPISGPKGTGNTFVEAELEYGQWRYEVLVVSVNGRSERINLADKPIRKRVGSTVPEVEASDGSRDAAKDAR